MRRGSKLQPRRIALGCFNDDCSFPLVKDFGHGPVKCDYQVRVCRNRERKEKRRCPHCGHLLYGLRRRSIPP